MMGWQNRPLARLGLALAAVLALGGCAGFGEDFSLENARPQFIDKSMSVRQAESAIAIEKSTKADVLAALGQASVIRFDSGHEVWVYRGKRLKAPATGAEFVVLFAPSGTVKKTRTRPAYDGRAEPLPG